MKTQNQAIPNKIHLNTLSEGSELKQHFVCLLRELPGTVGPSTVAGVCWEPGCRRWRQKQQQQQLGAYHFCVVKATFPILQITV